jgi:DNA-binding response OmpR family regulator
VDAPPADTNGARVLVVEDDESTAEAIAYGMRSAGMAPTVVPDGLAARRALGRLAPRLPIIVVTARTNEQDRVEVLSLGADDVMAKPFSMRELLARVTAALRRTAIEDAGSRRRPIQEGELRIDPERMSVIVAGRPVDLTPRELALLLALAEARDTAMARDEIFRRVWGRERAHGDRSVDVLVRRLRRKVDEAGGAHTYIQTLHGIGYRFAATPRRIPSADQAESRSA